jgi:hypothetical protein
MIGPAACVVFGGAIIAFTDKKSVHRFIGFGNYVSKSVRIEPRQTGIPAKDQDKFFM